MKPVDILHQRLYNQHLEGDKPADPVEIVKHLGAVQSQDFGGAAWAVAQRTIAAKAADFTAAFDRGTIIRTHVMRPTWHFVAAEDARWLLALTKQRLFQALSYYFKKFDLNDAVLGRTDAILREALQGGRQLTRAELAACLAEQHIAVEDNVRLSHIVFHAEGEGIICSGAMRGKQQTYALLEERIPDGKFLDPAAALVELTRRYFVSHGPATLEDFAWWSGLTKTDAARGIKAIEKEMQTDESTGKIYWSHEGHLQSKKLVQAHFLPNYDEYIVAYADRSGLFDGVRADLLDSRQNPLFNNVVVLDGAVVGTWKKVELREQVTYSLVIFRALDIQERQAVRMTAERYTAYLQASAMQIEGI